MVCCGRLLVCMGHPSCPNCIGKNATSTEDATAATESYFSGTFSANILESKYQMYVKTYKGRVGGWWNCAHNTILAVCGNPKGAGSVDAKQPQ